MCRNEGRVSTCHGKRKCGPNPQFWQIRTAILKSVYSDETFCRLTVGDEEFLFVLGDTWTRLDAAASVWDPVIQRVECLNCCIQYGVLTGLKQVTIIMGRNYIEGMKMSEAARKGPSEVDVDAQ